MNLFLPRVLLVIFAAMANIAYAQDDELVRRHVGEIALSDEAVQLNYLTTGDRFGAENVDTSFGVFLSEDRDVVLSGGALIESPQLSWRRLRVSVGTRGYAALLGQEDTDIVAFAGGAQVRYVIFPGRSIAVVAYGYYAPDILTFGSADNVRDVGAVIQAPVTERFTGFIGFRDFDVELLDDSNELESSVIFGVRYQY